MNLLDTYKRRKGPRGPLGEGRAETIEQAQFYPTDKSYMHYFLHIYDKLFEPFKDKQINFLEIGLWNLVNPGVSSSLHLWDDYFTHKNTKIFGVDICNPPPVSQREYSDRVQIHYFDINTIDESPLADEKYDIIIEDASHMLRDQRNFIKKFKHRLNPGGMFFIEDVASMEIVQHLLKEDNELFYIDSRNRISELEQTSRFDDLLIVYFND